MAKEFTERERGLILGTLEPTTFDEWVWVQNHANEVIPSPPPLRKSMFPSVNKQKLDANSWVIDARPDLY